MDLLFLIIFKPTLGFCNIFFKQNGESCLIFFQKLKKIKSGGLWCKYLKKCIIGAIFSNIHNKFVIYVTTWPKNSTDGITIKYSQNNLVPYAACMER